MWSFLVLLIIGGFVAAHQHNQYEQTPWKINQEYTYNVYARTLTGLPDLKDQYVGVITKGKLILHPKDNGEIVGKLVNIVHGHFHDELVNGLNSKISENDGDMNFQESELNNKPFIMHMKNGVIKFISVDNSMTNDQVNQLKAILSQLQIDLNGENLTKCRHNQLPENNNNNNNNKPNGHYKTLESVITGECETIYDISPLPEYMVKRSLPDWVPLSENVFVNQKDYNYNNNNNNNDNNNNKNDEWFQVVKTINFKNCNVRKGYNFGFIGSSNIKPNTNQMGDLLSKSSMTTVIASGHIDDYTIHQVWTTNRVAVSPDMKQKGRAQVISQIQLALVNVQYASKTMDGPQQSINAGNLVYTYNIPSDKQNRIRGISMDNIPLINNNQYKTSSYENMQFENKRIRREIEDDDQYSTEFDGNKSKNYNRKTFESTTDENSSAATGVNEFFQPQPNLQQSPEVPFDPYTIGYKGRSIKYDREINIEGEAKRLIQEIVNDLQNQDEIPSRNTLEKFDILNDIVQIMNYNQIETISKQYRFDSGYQQQQQQQQESDNVSEVLARKTFQDAVAQAGTGPAVKSITKWILERQVRGFEAVELFSILMKNVRIPTKEVIGTLFNLIKSDEVREQKQLYPTALIAFTDLIRWAQADKETSYNRYPVQTFGPFYKNLEEIVTKDVIPYLAHRLQEAVQEKNAQKVLLYLRALGNTGHPNIIGVFEKYIESDDELTPFQRTALVLALDRLTEIYPKLSQRILMKIYVHVGYTPETRTAAVHLLMRTKPSAVTLQAMATYTNDDPSEAVQAVVKSAIESAAELTAPEWLEFAENARSAKQFLNPREYGRQYSKTYLSDYVNENLNLIYKQQLSHIVGRHNTFPKAILYSQFKNYGGYNEHNVEVQAMISSVDDLLRMIPGGKYTNGDQQETKEIYSQQVYNSDENQEWSTGYIDLLLNMIRTDVKDEEEQEVQGQILFKTLGFQRYFSFDEKDLKDLPQHLAGLLSALRSGEKFIKNKLYNQRKMMIAFPLATGYPFVYTLSTPTLLQAIGKIEGKTIPDIAQSPSWKALYNLEAINASARVHFVYGGEEISKTGFVTPFEHHTYIAGHLRKVQGQIPVNVKVDIDLANRQVTGNVQPLEPGKNFKAFYTSAVPFTARKNILHFSTLTEAKEFKLINIRQSEQFERTIGEKTIGMVIRTNIEHQIPEMDQIEIEEILQTQGIMALTKLPFSYHTTKQGISNKQAFSPLSFFPYSFQPRLYGLSEKQILLTLATLPISEELTTQEFIKVQGFLSFLTMPFADIDTLHSTVKYQGVPSMETVWPLRTCNYYKMEVIYDAQKSVNHAIRFGFNLERAFNTEKYINLLQKNKLSKSMVFDQEKIHPVQLSNERRQQLLANVVDDVKQASSAVFDAVLAFDGKNPAEYVVTVAQAESPVNKKERIFAFFRAKSIQMSSPQQMCISYTGRFPKTPVLSFTEAIKANNNNKANVNIEATYGENCATKPSSRVNLKAVLQQSQEYKDYLIQSDLGKICQNEMKQGNHQMPFCQEATYRASILDDIKISADAENLSPAFKNVTNGALNILRHIGFWNYDENVNMKGKHNKLEATLRLSPNLRRINGNIQTENGMHHSSIPLTTSAVRTFFDYYPQVDTSVEHYRQVFRNGQVCVIDQNKVITFDNNEFEQKLGKCWYTLVHYIAHTSRFTRRNEILYHEQPISVLMRESTQSAGQREVLISVQRKQDDVGKDYVVQIKPAGSSMKIIINGKTEQISKDKAIEFYDNDGKGHTTHQDYHRVPILRIYELPGGEIQVDIRNKYIQINFDGVRIRIQAAPFYRNKVKGLCGNYNGEEVDDLITPNNCVLKNTQLLAPSWALNDGETCSNDVIQMKMKAEQAFCSPVKYVAGNVISSWESGRHHSADSGHKWTSSSSRSSSSSSSSDSSENSSSSSSSENSSSSSSEEDKNQFNGRRHGMNQFINQLSDNARRRLRSCNIRRQVQYVEHGGQTCFTIAALPACPKHCRFSQTEQKHVPVHCRDSRDSISEHYKEQIRNGVNPDLSGKEVNNNVTFNVPRSCVTST